MGAMSVASGAAKRRATTRMPVLGVTFAVDGTDEEAQKARKRALIEKRKKQQAKSKSRTSETQVVMRVARGESPGEDGESPPAGDTTVDKGMSCVSKSPYHAVISTDA